MSQDEETTVTRDGYQFTFYPGFVSRCTLTSAQGDVELYQQEETYRLPAGQTRPNGKHRLTLAGGRKKQNVTLRVEDPEHRIKSITVELYESSTDDAGSREGEGVETITIHNDAKMCPPNC